MGDRCSWISGMRFNNSTQHSSTRTRYRSGKAAWFTVSMVPETEDTRSTENTVASLNDVTCTYA